VTTSSFTTSCNACMRVAAKHGVEVGYSVTMPSGKPAQVVALNHIFGQTAVLIDDGYENYMVSLHVVAQK
jgi:hypothetical protein